MIINQKLKYMYINKIIKGLQIIAKYLPEGDSGYTVSAEHDMIYAGDTTWEMSPADLEELEELGWDKDDDLERFTMMV